MQTDWTLTERDGVCLVEVVVDNPAPVDRRVSVSNRLDGPVMPPRREGVPERGWDDDGFEGTVPAEGRLALGYACPAPAARPPVAVETSGRVDGDADAGGDAGTDADADPPADATPEAVVRRLGTHAPPADAVPVPSPSDGEARDASREVPDAFGGNDPSGEVLASDAPTGDARDPPDAPRSPPDSRLPSDEFDSDAVPDDVAAWFAAVGARVDRADRLDGASVAAATAAVREAGGLEAAAALPNRLSADAAALRAVARRADRLADRAEAAEVPVDALRRLA